MLALPDYNQASLCWRETRIVYLRGELVLDERERELREQGMGVEQIARDLSKLRNELRSWTRTLIPSGRSCGKPASFVGTSVSRRSRRPLSPVASYENW
jgi:hypothetical protein